MNSQVFHAYQLKPDDQVSRDPGRSNTGSESTGSESHNSGSNPRPRGIPPWMRSLLMVGIMLAIWYLVLIFLPPGAQTNGQSVVEIPYSAFSQQLEAGNVKNAVLEGQEVTGEFKQAVTIKDTQGTAQTVTHYRAIQLPNGDPNLVPLLNEHQVEYQAKPVGKSSPVLTMLLSVLPWVVLFGFFYFMARRATQGQQGFFGFGKSRAKVILQDRPGTTFADVAGVESAKNDLVEVIEFLKTPQKFQRLGGKIPRGLLLVGPPGTGKTLLARAVAGEAGVPFFSISGSEFVEMVVGVGASRVRDLFEQAKKAAPSIIFIDEIDAVGRQRGASINSNDEREQTLNQLLVEMDGFDNRQAVVVIGATNRPDGLDQALLRPGRFDRRVTVDRPDWNGRLAILKIHTRSVPLDHDVDLTAIARSTTGMVGADLANLVNEAALLAARRNLDRVTQRCFEEALDKILLGAERPLVLSEEDLNVTAYHEGGHALTGLLSEGADPVTKVTIVPRGQALGVTMSTPLDDRYNYSKEYLLTQIVTALGGRAAEQVVFNRVTTGAENDFQKVTALARQMVTRWGMSERLGTISFSERQSPFLGGGDTGAPADYSEETAELIDEEVERIVRECYARAVDILTTHRPTLDRIAQELRRHETIDAKQLQTILEETGVSVPPAKLQPQPGRDGTLAPPPPPVAPPGQPPTMP